MWSVWNAYTMYHARWDPYEMHKHNYTMYHVLTRWDPYEMHKHNYTMYHVLTRWDPYEMHIYNVPCIN